MMTWPGSDLIDVLDRQRAVAVRQDDVGDAGLLRRARLSSCAALMTSRIRSVSPSAGLDRDAGEDALVGAGDDDVAAGGDAPGRDQARQQALQAVDGRGAILPDRGDAVEPLGEQIGERGEVAFDRRRASAGSGRPPARRRRGRW